MYHNSQILILKLILDDLFSILHLPVPAHFPKVLLAWYKLSSIQPSPNYPSRPSPRPSYSMKPFDDCFRTHQSLYFVCSLLYIFSTSQSITAKYLISSCLVIFCLLIQNLRSLETNHVFSFSWYRPSI